MPSYVAIHRDAEGHQRQVTDHDEVVRLIRSATGLTWLHLAGPGADDTAMLEEDFGLHPLPVEDTLNHDYQRPKIEEYDTHTFLLVHGIDYLATAENVTTAELDLFVGDHWVISSSLVSMPSIAHVLEETRSGREDLPASAAVLAYALVDAVVDNTLPIIDRMDDVADLIEEEALANPNPALLEHLIRLKRSLMRLNRVMGPQALLLAQLTNGRYPRLAPAQILFRDIHDHVLWIEERVTSLRERTDHAVSTYHSALSIKQNETMRVLSIVASIFLPLTLLAGIYGMNFQNMPELGWEYGYFVVLGIIVASVAVGTYALFGRSLLGWGRDRIGDLASFALEPPVVTEAVREASRLRSRLLRTGRISRPGP